jgi:hypothetical protein
LRMPVARPVPDVATWPRSQPGSPQQAVKLARQIAARTS